MKKFILLLFLIFPLILNAQGFWGTEVGWTIVYDDTLGIGYKSSDWSSARSSALGDTMFLTDTTKAIEFNEMEGTCTLAAIWD